MPISIVVGGQFGSEGKGKIALEIARRSSAPVTVIRVGGPNSGHTAYDIQGRKWALRQMPASCVDKNVDVVFPAGAYIDAKLLLQEIDALNYPKERIFVSPYARIILEEHRRWESEATLTHSIGSTGSGVGAAVMASVARGAKNFPLESADAEHCQPLHDFILDVAPLLARKLKNGERIVIEGTQGFGLSLLDGGFWPKATSRYTTAAGALAEAGLSPLQVDDVTLVTRSFPIRVGGDSGPLLKETTWENVAAITAKSDLREFTTVTGNVRRVGFFDSEIVNRAIAANHPSRIVVNHMDYLGSEDDLSYAQNALTTFLDRWRSEVVKPIDWYGFSPLGIAVARENVK